MSPSPPHIAVLGAGPVGLEAALAAAEAGLPFTLYEEGEEVASHVAAWGHVRLFTPWSLSVSPRMRRRLTEVGREVPDAPDVCPTGAELRDRVLRPVAELPEIATGLRLGRRVVAVGREGLLKHEEIATAKRGAARFRLLVEEEGERHVEHADVVLDCSGTWGHPNAVGTGGIPAPGEESLGERLVRWIPDLETEASAWAGRTILLVGAGHSAQTAIHDLALLAAENEGTRVVWALRRSAPEWNVDPDDPLPARAALSRRAEALARGASPAVEVRTGVEVEAFVPEGERVRVVLRDHDGVRHEEVVDRVLGLTGSVGDATLYRQLQVHECYATSGPMKLAAALLGAGSADCLDQASHGVEALKSPEPGFFLLGSKSYGRNNTFLLRVGWAQVDEVLGELAGEAGPAASA